jgi:hypothetical protein
MAPEIVLGLGELAMAGAVALGVSLQFARWAIRRQDKFDAELDVAEMAPEVRKMKLDTLYMLRNRYTDRLENCVRIGNDSRTIQQEIEAVDREISRLLEPQKPAPETMIASSSATRDSITNHLEQFFRPPR